MRYSETYISGNQTWLAGKSPNRRFTAGTVIKLNGVFFIAMFDYPRDNRYSGG
jgi:hypothetical protein